MKGEEQAEKKKKQNKTKNEPTNIRTNQRTKQQSNRQTDQKDKELLTKDRPSIVVCCYNTNNSMSKENKIHHSQKQSVY